MPPTLVIWLIGIYTAVFGVASSRYEGRLNSIETLSSATITQLSNDKARPNSFFMIGQSQGLKIYPKPEYFSVWTTLSSMLSEIDPTEFSYSSSTINWKLYYSVARIVDCDEGKCQCKNFVNENYTNYECIDWNHVYGSVSLQPSIVEVLKKVTISYKNSYQEDDVKLINSRRYLTEHQGAYGNAYRSLTGFSWVYSPQSHYSNWDGKNDVFIEGGLIGVDLTYSHLEGGDLSDTHLEYTDFSNAYLVGTLFNGSHLAETKFLNASLNGATFSNSHMRSVFFSEANLSNTDFRSAEILGSYFNGSNLRGSSFRYSDIKGSIFFDSVFDKRTDFKMVRNIEYACFDVGVKDKIVKTYNIEIDIDKLIEGNEFCKEKRNL